MAVVDGSEAGEESLVMEWDEPQQLLISWRPTVSTSSF